MRFQNGICSSSVFKSPRVLASSNQDRAVAVLHPWVTSSGINACVLTDGRVSVVVHKGDMRITEVFEAVKLRPVAELILAACAFDAQKALRLMLN